MGNEGVRRRKFLDKAVQYELIGEGIRGDQFALEKNSDILLQRRISYFSWETQLVSCDPKS